MARHTGQYTQAGSLRSTIFVSIPFPLKQEYRQGPFLGPAQINFLISTIFCSLTICFFRNATWFGHFRSFSRSNICSNVGLKTDFGGKCGFSPFDRNNRILCYNRLSDSCLSQCWTQKEIRKDQIIMYSLKCRPAMSKKSLSWGNLGWALIDTPLFLFLFLSSFSGNVFIFYHFSKLSKVNCCVWIFSNIATDDFVFLSVLGKFTWSDVPLQIPQDETLGRKSVYLFKLFICMFFVLSVRVTQQLDRGNLNWSLSRGKSERARNGLSIPLLFIPKRHCLSNTSWSLPDS